MNCRAVFTCRAVISKPAECTRYRESAENHNRYCKSFEDQCST